MLNQTTYCKTFTWSALCILQIWLTLVASRNGKMSFRRLKRKQNSSKSNNRLILFVVLLRELLSIPQSRSTITISVLYNFRSSLFCWITDSVRNP